MVIVGKVSVRRARKALVAASPAGPKVAFADIGLDAVAEVQTLMTSAALSMAPEML
jgi:hypothetical protein